MKRKSWAKQELQKIFSRCDNLKEILDCFLEMVGKDHSILEIEVNERFLKVDPEEFEFIGLEQIESLKIGFVNSDLLLIQSCESLRGFVQDVQNQCFSCADHYREEKMVEAVKGFESILEATDWFVEGLVKIRENVETRKTFGQFSESWQATEMHMSTILQRVLETFQKRDFLLLADLLEYELVGSLEKWSENLQKIEKYYVQSADRKSKSRKEFDSEGV